MGICPKAKAKSLHSFSVNGVATSVSQAVNIADHLEDMFNRRITCVGNKTLGLWFDLVECILQRDVLLITSDIREGYHPIRDAIRNKDLTRIVVIGHSQGGLICSAWAVSLI